MFFQNFSRTPTAKYKKKKEKKKKINLPTHPIFFGTVTGNKQFFLRPYKPFSLKNCCIVSRAGLDCKDTDESAKP